jgi:rhamnogalacturonyl hydrolase YesR
MQSSLIVLAVFTFGATAAEVAGGTPVSVKRMVVWDGEQANIGAGWVNLTTSTIKPQTVEAHSGKTALEFKFKGSNEWLGAGWNWFNFKTGANVGTDASAMKNLSFWIKTKGKAGNLHVNLLCNGNVLDTPEEHTVKVAVSKYCPQFLDGQWHEVVIPLADLNQIKGFNPKIISEIHFGFMAGKDTDGSFFIDDMAFDDRAGDPPPAAQTAPANYSVVVARSFIERMPDPNNIHWVGQNNSFSWQAGYIMFAMEKMWRWTGDPAYFNYIKKYVDEHVDDKGNAPRFSSNALDNFLPGYAIIFMYEQTKEEKYKIAANKVRNGFINYPRNSDGSFWHGDWARHQLWVDGVFMGQMFLARYGGTLDDSANSFGEVARQMKLALQHCQKPNGLLLHGWDESKQASWANKETGLAPEVWSEGLGWYAVLIADVFDYLPKSHPDYPVLMSALQKLCLGLKEVQDPQTGMWCQVVDKCGQPGNWNETSGTGMFLYLLKKAIDKEYISSEEYSPVVKRAYEGIIKKTRLNEKGLVDLVDCSSIGIQNNYQAYISQPKEVSTFAAFGSFIIGTGIMEKPKK